MLVYLPHGRNGTAEALACPSGTVNGAARGGRLLLMADRRERLHREMIDAIPRDRIADTVISALSIIEQMAATSRAALCYEELWAE